MQNFWRERERERRSGCIVAEIALIFGITFDGEEGRKGIKTIEFSIRGDPVEYFN